MLQGIWDIFIRLIMPMEDQDFLEQQLEATQDMEGWFKSYQVLNQALFVHLEHLWTYYILDFSYIKWKFIVYYVFWIKVYLLLH